MADAGFDGRSHESRYNAPGVAYVEARKTVKARRLSARRAALWAVVPCTLVLAGCQGAIQGDWYLAEATPNRQVFSIDKASFRADGTYSATTTIEGVTNNEKGTYEFSGFKLTLLPQAGGQRSYTASMQPGQLQLATGNRRIVLKKGTKGQ